jgi:cytosine/creatinine deaminase
MKETIKKEEYLGKTDFEIEIRKSVRNFGGFLNAHIDRAFTFADRYPTHVGKTVSDLSGLTLAEKQDLVGAIHEGRAYNEEDLRERMERVIEQSMDYNVTKICSAIDTTGSDKIGLSALEIALKLKEKYKTRVDLQLGAYNVFGFKNDEPRRWEIFSEAAKKADFLVGLQERDERDGHIGEEQHIKRILNLGYELKKPVHFHVDQANVPGERRTEILIEQVHHLFDVYHETKNYPEVWAVHAISPSCYDEDRFLRLCDNLIKYHIGVICCPSAGISMRSDKTQNSPVHNSLARIWTMMSRGVSVKLGSDNINDVFVPSSSPDMFDEVLRLSDCLRFYDTRILSKLASGQKINNFDRATIKRAFNLL